MQRIVAVVGFLGALVATASPAAEVLKPNVVLINIDDMGYADVGAFGSQRNRTPNIDSLAAEGMKLTCFYAAPVCSPSRAALMTGCYPKRVGIPNVLFPAGTTGISPSETTLAEVLRGQGYETLCIGKWHLGDQPEFLPTRNGFDHYFGLPYSNDMGPAEDGARAHVLPPKNAKQAAKRKNTSHPPLPLLRDEKVVQRMLAKDQQQLVTWYTDEAVQFLQQPHDKPFFLYLPHSAVHVPLYPGPNFRGKSPHGEYSDWVEEVDASVGRVVATLKQQKLADNTLILFMSDNGGTSRAVNAPLRGFKASTLEGGMRVPLILRWPGKIPAGATCDALTSNMDLLPTLARLTGAKLASDRKIDGHDLWPLVTGQTQQSPYDVFYFFKGNELQAVRSGPWKLQLASGALYNLTNDLGEATDLAQANPDVVKHLRALAKKTDSDLGQEGVGPGCREPGKAPGAKPLIDRDGTIRAGFAAG